MIRDPDLGRMLDLYGHTDGVLGTECLELPAVVSDAVAIISDARAWRMEREAAEAAKKAKQK